jgi:cellobiose transport system permease protein
VWNDFFWPLVVLKNEAKYTIQLALSQLHSIREGVDYGMIMAATLLATLPLMVVFLLFSRWFIAGITTGSIKS